MGSQIWSVVVARAMVASMASMVASMTSMASMDATMASLALVASRIWVSDLNRRKLSNEMLRFSPMENWLGSSTKQTWVDGRSRRTRRVGVDKMKKELTGSLIWSVVMTQSEEGADGLSDIGGDDWWRRWMASMVDWVFDTEGTEVEVPLCPQ